MLRPSVVLVTTLLAGEAALSGCGAAGRGVSVPFCSGLAQAPATEIDSSLAGVDVRWEIQPTEAQSSALEAALRAEAGRRGYAFGASASKSRWVLVRRAVATGNLGAGDRPLTHDGYPAALADRLRRANPRGVPPTRAELELSVKKFDFAVWVGRARFDPDDSDPVASDEAAVRALMAEMPRFARVTPAFERLAPDRFVAYYTKQLEGRTFFCPVLPYPVRFPDLELSYHRGGNSPNWEDTVNSHSFEDPTLFPACVDLIRHADFALPKEIPGYVDPAAPELWRDVTLFDVYRDASGAEVPLEVRLRGDTRGYHVTEVHALGAPQIAARAEAAKRFADETAALFEATGR